MCKQKTPQIGASSSIFAHHQEEEADIVIGVLVPVVAVESVLVEVARDQAVAILVEKCDNPSAPLLFEYS